MSASNVVVVDSRARRAVIKVTPSTHLSDVLVEACKKLGLSPDPYGLRSNNKLVDLSRTIRLSGLSSGAKLELVLQSRSPSVVTVALQLPESESQDVPGGRLVDKFPSTTTLWLMLRKFESGAEDGGAPRTRNFTGRGVPQMNEGSSGAGRLHYETPVLQFMQRELSTFTDLQRTLAQLGFNNGSALFRLSFRATEQPLEGAMAEIEQYFGSINTEKSAGAHSESVAKAESTPDPDNPDAVLAGGSARSPPETPGETAEATPAIPEAGPVACPALPGSTLVDEQEVVDDQTIVGPDRRPISVFAAPSSSTPQAARYNFNESDYEPTIDHAKQHQARLSLGGRNKRLPSEAEIRAQQASTAQKLSSIQSVELKIRFPDQTQVVSTFTAVDSVTTLYDFIRSMIQHAQDPFTLSYTSAKGPRVLGREAEEGRKVRLIQDLGLTGRVLVNFVWEPSASDEARQARVLREEFAEKAKELSVADVSAVTGVGDDEEEGARARGWGGDGKENLGASSRGAGSGNRVPKWLKLPGKK